ncbi:MAG: hypothetical protein ACI814_002107 [Mariniblastus sp.]|jgi:hypothetical protein
MSTNPTPKHRWCRLSLRWTMVLTFVVAGMLAYRTDGCRRQCSAVKAIRELGGTVLYGYHVGRDGRENPDALPTHPKWLRNLLGDDYLYQVTSVSLRDTEMTDKLMVHLSHLPTLESLDLAHTSITDDGIRQLRNLKWLQFLCLNRTLITDEGLDHLSSMVKLCKLDLHCDQISKGAIDRLGPKLPDSDICQGLHRCSNCRD